MPYLWLVVARYCYEYLAHNRIAWHNRRHDKRESRSERMSLCVTPTLRAELESRAKAHERTLSWVVCDLLTTALNAEKKDMFDR